jgi:hypothetical protein
MAEGHGTLDRASHPWGAPAVGESSAERDARTTQETIDNVRGRYDAKYWSIEEAQAKRPPKQWVSMERWRRIEPTGGYTLLCAHAGGLQKEVSRKSKHCGS